MIVSTLIGLECSLPPLLDFWKNKGNSCKCEAGREISHLAELEIAQQVNASAKF